MFLQPHPHGRFTSRAIFVAVIVIALLASQWLGMMHRVAHGTRMSAPSVRLSLPVTPNATSIVRLADSWSDATHSCTVFDAATLGNGLTTATYLVPPLPNSHILAIWIAFISRAHPFQPHFLSRAPPAC